MAEENRLNQSIKKFLDVYRVLSPEAKAAFEAQLTSAIRSEDEATRKLYDSLLKAAKEGMDTEDTLKQMHKARKENKNG